MGELDRLGWAAGLAFVSHGVRLGIRVNDAAVMDRLPAFLPPGSVPSTSAVVHDLYSLIVGSNGPRSNVRRYNLLYEGSARLARTMDLEQVFEALQEHLHLLLAIRAPRRLFVRAGVVGWRGRAVIIPGDHAPGITSIVSALVRAGATYYSNMYAVLDTRGRVHAYPTPLADGAAQAPLRTPRSPTRRKPLPVGLIAVVTGEPGPSRPSRELSSAQAALALLRHTVASRVRPAFALDVLGRSVSGAVALDLAREDHDDEMTHLLDRLNGVPGRIRACLHEGDSHAPARATRQPARPADR